MDPGLTCPTKRGKGTSPTPKWVRFSYGAPLRGLMSFRRITQRMRFTPPYFCNWRIPAVSGRGATPGTGFRRKWKNRYPPYGNRTRPSRCLPRVCARQKSLRKQASVFRRHRGRRGTEITMQTARIAGPSLPGQSLPDSLPCLQFPVALDKSTDTPGPIVELTAIFFR